MKITDQTIAFKNSKTGKLESIPIGDIESCQWTRMACKPALRLFLKNGNMMRFGGFADSVRN